MSVVVVSCASHDVSELLFGKFFSFKSNFAVSYN